MEDSCETLSNQEIDSESGDDRKGDSLAQANERDCVESNYLEEMGGEEN